MANNHPFEGVWPVGLDDLEVLWLIDRANDRFELEMGRRHPGHRLWSMPLVRGEDRISFYVRNQQAMGNIPNIDVAENAVLTLFEFMEGQRGNLDMDYVTNNGLLAVRLQYWVVEPPILLAVLGESVVEACFRFQYFYRNREPLDTLTVAVLDR